MNFKNLILYGPPGTGKTWYSSQLAVSLIENLREAEIREKYPGSSRNKLKQKFRQYQQEGRIAFVTFHQSFSYEDFVEGIKPFRNEKNELYYDVEDGVFKQICYNTAYSLFLTQQKRLIQRAAQPGRHNFEVLYVEFLDYLKRMMKEGSGEVVFETITQKPVYLENINKNDTLEFRYEKGTRKYGVTKSIVSKLYRHFKRADGHESLQEDIQRVAGKGNSSLYWATLNRLKDFEKTRHTTYNYIINQRQFKGQQVSEEQYLQMKRDLQLLDYMTLSKDDYKTAGNFVLIIDEINRGNIAGIFGELITLLEEDKRAGMPETLQTVLPYSREQFTVPPNLYIIGTMNTADRSIEALDAALRRRFSFRELRPEPELLKINKNTRRKEIESLAAESAAAYHNRLTLARNLPEGIDLSTLLTVMNLRLEKLTDREHCIGHGYFFPVLHATDALQTLKQIFYEQIIPLLQEYFFSDFAKIELVIGKAFFEKGNGTGDSAHEFFAETDQDVSMMEEFLHQPSYKIKRLDDQAFVQAVKRIYEQQAG